LGSFKMTRSDVGEAEWKKEVFPRGNRETRDKAGSICDQREERVCMKYGLKETDLPSLLTVHGLRYKGEGDGRQNQAKRRKSECTFSGWGPKRG